MASLFYNTTFATAASTNNPADKSFASASLIEQNRKVEEEMRKLPTGVQAEIYAKAKQVCDGSGGTAIKSLIILGLIEGARKELTSAKNFAIHSAKRPSSKKVAPTATRLAETVDHTPKPKDNDLPKTMSGYAIFKTLGKGTFGRVVLAQKPEIGETYAIKIIDRSKVKTLKEKISVEREIRLMKLLNHPNIIGVHEIIETQDNKTLIVMEHAKRGELFEYIVSKGKLGEVESRKMFRQVLSAIDYCHQNSIIHRDLKPENLLLDSEYNVKLIDFGFGNTYHRERLLETFCGSPFYAAPEMIQGIKYVGPEVDVWSLGVILYTLLSGKLPFDGNNLNELYERIAAGQYMIPEEIEREPAMLIGRMLVVDPLKRAKIEEIKNNSWLNIGYTAPQPNYIPVERPRTPLKSEEINEASLAELVSYGFHARDCKVVLSRVEGIHPISSLYHLIDEARKRREAAKTLKTTSFGSVPHLSVELNANISTSYTDLSDKVKNDTVIEIIDDNRNLLDNLHHNIHSRPQPVCGRPTQMPVVIDSQLSNTQNTVSAHKNPVRGILNISTTSSKDLREISAAIQNALARHNISYSRPTLCTYQCMPSLASDDYEFVIEIKAIDLTKSSDYAIKMHRVRGSAFHHNRFAKKFLSELDL